MTNFFQSNKINALLRALPQNVATNVYNKIEEVKNERIAVCVYSSNASIPHRFASCLFNQPHALHNRKKTGGDLGWLNTGQVGYFPTSRSTDLASPFKDDINIVIWVVDMEDINEGDTLDRPDGSNRVITVLNHTPETYKELKNRESEIAKQIANIKRTVICSGSIIDVCIENGEGLNDVAKAFVKKYPNNKQIFAAHVIKSKYIDYTLNNKVVGSYASFISTSIRSHFDRDSEEKQNEIKALINHHIGEELKKGGVALVTNVVGAVFSGIGSLFRAIKK